MTAVPVAMTIAGLLANTTYHFRLVATNGVGSAQGADATLTTPGPTLATSSASVDHGRTALLSGTVPTPSANQTVTLHAQRVIDGSFALVPRSSPGPVAHGPST